MLPGSAPVSLLKATSRARRQNQPSLSAAADPFHTLWGNFRQYSRADKAQPIKLRSKKEKACVRRHGPNMEAGRSERRAALRTLG